MSAPERLGRIVVVGGSIAAVTAADTLRVLGYDGELTLVSAEDHPPYSRVPLSKGVLVGAEEPESAKLAALPDSVEVVLGTPAVGLDTGRRQVTLSDGRRLRYDGLVIATGARARRLAGPGQRGELVVRDLPDALDIAKRAGTARTAVVVGAGFLGMEVASTLLALGLTVTVVDRDPPLRRLLGPWLSDHVVRTAERAGLQVVVAEDGVVLEGDPITAVAYGRGHRLEADLVITAAGDHPTVDWLESSGLRIEGGLVVDRCCRVAPGIVAAGDVTAVEDPAGSFHRTPHWTSAVEQARTAARCLLDQRDDTPYEPDPYFWTEQFGLDIKISGHLPLLGEPLVLAGEPATGHGLVQWSSGGRPHAAAAINHKIAIIKLKRLRTELHPAAS